MLYRNELMRTYCTLSDKNYLIKGLALIDSLLEKSSEELTIYYLCMDDETYNKLISLENKNIIPIGISSLEKEKDFKTLKENTKYSPDWCSYCFALGSYFTEYIIRIYKVKDILYIDSDIIFYQDPKYIFEEIDEKSIGIMLHRHNKIGAPVGGYNVGVVYFKNNDIGYKCLKWWRDCVMDKTNKWYSRYGKTGGGDGDQKYLEGFEPLFGKDNISVIDEGIGHGAPWNFTLYQYDGEDIIWKSKRQKMIFIHFSHFTPNYKSGTYAVDKNGEWKNPQNTHVRIKKYYDDYFDSLLNTKIKYNL
tara:strand:- start:113 stop:1024 length:912 start_codon:yes stop_codon:yes gene_type:complete